jgi:hypothetical protein
MNTNPQVDKYHHGGRPEQKQYIFMGALAKFLILFSAFAVCPQFPALEKFVNYVLCFVLPKRRG